MLTISLLGINIPTRPVTKQNKKESLKKYANYLKETLHNDFKSLSLSSYNKTLKKIEVLEARSNDNKMENPNEIQEVTIVDDATEDNQVCFELVNNPINKARTLGFITNVPQIEFTEEYLNDMFSTIHS